MYSFLSTVGISFLPALVTTSVEVEHLFEAILRCVLMNNHTDISIKVPVMLWAVFDCIVSNWFFKGMLVLRTHKFLCVL